MRSIRRALRLRLLVGLTALFALLGVGLYLVIEEVLEEQLDRALESRAGLLASLVKRESDGELEIEIAEEPMPEFERRKRPEYFQIFASDGAVVARSPSLAGRDLPRRKLKGRRDQAFFDLELPDGRPGRAIMLRFVPRAEGRRGSGADPAVGGPLLLVTTADRSKHDEALLGVAGALAGTGLLLLLGGALVVGLVVGRGLRPLAALADQASRIDTATLGVRFPVGGIPDELGAISARLNDLLGRLQASFERERRFSADVAHELRTPIAELRSMAEVALKFPDGTASPEAAAELARETLELAVLMERMVNNLLGLARCDAGLQEVAREPVDLAEAVREAWRPFEARAAARRLRASFELASVSVETDRALLGAMLTNLLDNAVEYAPESSHLSCTVAADDGGGVEAAFGNSAPQIEDADLPHLFEPFWRKDVARTDRAHSGLGLALVAAYARRLGVEVTASRPRPDWLALRVRFPPAGPAPAASG